LFDAEMVRDALVEALPDAAPVVSLEPIPRGWGNESWRVETALGTLIAKIGLPWSDVGKWRAASRALELARDAGVPAPELLAFVDSADTLEGRVFRVFRYVEGTTANVDAPASLFYELGVTMRRLHSVEMPVFTSRFDAGGFARWSEFLEHRWPSMLGRAERAGIDPTLVAGAQATATALAIQVDDVVQPALCHRDLYLDNVLVDDDGAFVALLDFDVAEVWDPLVEQFKLEWFVFEPNPAARVPFFDGYLAGGLMPPMFDERVRLASIVELLNHAANWLVQGQVDVAAEALVRLGVLLAVRGP
jgi:aminoglycoside phosphotransferase (APT) family kinase protein